MATATGAFTPTHHVPPPSQRSPSDHQEPLRPDAEAVQRAIDLALAAMNQVAGAQQTLKLGNQGAMPDHSVVLWGKSGSGKTTLVYALAGQPLNVTVDSDTNVTTLQPAHPMPGFVVGVTKASETSVPGMWLCPDPDHPETGISVIDLPGCFETRGTSQEIANAVRIQKVFSSCPETKIVILAGVDELTSLGNGFSSTISVLSQTFSSDIKRIAKAVSLVVTRVVDETEDDLRTHIDQIIESIDLTDMQKELLRELKGRITLFRAPVDSSPRSFDAGATAASVFANVRNKCEFVQNPKVTIALSEKASKDALEAHNVLIGSVNTTVRTIMQNAISSAKTFVQRSLAELNAADQMKLDSEDTKLQELLTRIRGVSGEIQSMVTGWTEIVQRCGGNSLAIGAIDTMMRELELAHVLKQWVEGERAIPFDGVEHMKEQALVVCSIFEEARSTVGTLKATLEAQREEARKETAEAEAKKEKERAPSKLWAALEGAGVAADCLGNLCTAVSNGLTAFVQYDMAKLSLEEKKLAYCVAAYEATQHMSQLEEPDQPKGNTTTQNK